MTKKLAYMMAAFLSVLVSAATAARADWPAKVFAPYVYLTKPGTTELTTINNATGQKYFTMAFMNSENANPYWENLGPITNHIYRDQIAAIRAKGGDIIMSFGGASAGDTGKELGMAEQDPVKLQAKYQAIVNEYKLTWIDQDIEGKATGDPARNHRRNIALAALQKANPGLIIAFTLAADPNGIEKESLDLLRDAKAQGIKVQVVNLMTMDYGPDEARGKKMGDMAIATVAASYKQMQALDPAMKVGITNLIGINDERSEIFGLDDARIVMNWVKDKDFVRLIAFWVSSRDNNHNGADKDDLSSGVDQKDWDFINIFKPFTTGFAPATRPERQMR